jgi:DNA-binding transcriptional ArsR family regulator
MRAFLIKLAVCLGKAFYTHLNYYFSSEVNMKPFMVIREPEAYQLLADETRRKMLYLLRVKEMNVNQLAEELGMTSQAVYHHVRKLLKGNMIEVVREERTGHLIESYYRATADDFILSHGKVTSQTIHDKKLAEEQTAGVLNALKKFGLSLEFDEKKISQLVELRADIDGCCATSRKPEIEDEIWNMDELNLLMKVMAIDLLGILLMSNKEFAKQQENREKLRAFLLSLVKKDKKLILHKPSVHALPAQTAESSR